MAVATLSLNTCSLRGSAIFHFEFTRPERKLMHTVTEAQKKVGVKSVMSRGTRASIETGLAACQRHCE